MPQALALAAQIVATLALLVIPVLGLFLLSLALRQAAARNAVRVNNPSCALPGGRRPYTR